MTALISRGVAAVVLLLSAGAAGAVETVVSGSAYVDYWGVPDAQVRPDALQGMTPTASLKVQADVDEDLTFSAKACMSCHGIEMDHVMLDWQPKAWFNVQAGRIAVPFGDFSNRIDPSSHKTASAPLIYDMGRMAYGGASAMNLGVIPQPYVDTGVLLYGQDWLWKRLQIWYGAYGVAGFKGSNDVAWASMRGGSYRDNNGVPAAGGRVVATWSGNPGGLFGDVSLGGSFTGGRYDDANRLGYAAYGVDAAVQVGPVQLRGEFADRRTDVDPDAQYAFVLVDDFFEKSGWYAEAEVPLGRFLSAVGRVDQLRRSGVPLAGADDEAHTFERITRTTAGVMVTPVSAMFVKAGWEYWDTMNRTDFHSFHLGVGGAF